MVWNSSKYTLLLWKGAVVIVVFLLVKVPLILILMFLAQELDVVVVLSQIIPICSQPYTILTSLILLDVF